MPTLISKQDPELRYEYETAVESSQTIQLDGNRIIPGHLSDYTIEGAPLAPLAPLDFYLAFKTKERMDIKASPDALVQEFWNTYERCERLNKPINPNSPAVQHGLAYLAQPTTATPAGAGILKSVDRIAEILAGVAQ